MQPNTESIYYAIVRFKTDNHLTMQGSEIVRGSWRGTVPEETGHNYESLCSYQRDNEYTTFGGFRLDVDGTMTRYTEAQLIADAEPKKDDTWDGFVNTLEGAAGYRVMP